MNPLDLPGPQFLLFYVCLTAAVLIALWALLGQAEKGEIPRISFNDPYRIAYLRGGKNEAARVAVISLVDRGLLEVDGSQLKSSAKIDAETTASIENALLRKFEETGAATSIFDDPLIERACADYEAELMRLRLLPDPLAKERRQRYFLMAAFVLGGVSLAKIVVALARGRHSVFLLVLLTAGGIGCALALTNRFRTARGNALLADLRTLFAGLKDRSSRLRAGGATAEAALLAAVFGVGALPQASFPHAKQLYPKAASSSATSSGGCGTACGSSCGGGSCGGGCGGCGG